MEGVSGWVGDMPCETWTTLVAISVVASEIPVFDKWGAVEGMSSISSLRSLIEFKRGTWRIGREYWHACST